MQPMMPTMPIASGGCCLRRVRCSRISAPAFLARPVPCIFSGAVLIWLSHVFPAGLLRVIPGGVPHLPNAVAQEAYSHEVSSAGFWPGGGGPIEDAAFYSYAYPAPEGFAAAKVKPAQAIFSKELGEFLLPYDAVRTARDPDAALMEFLQTTYDAVADLAKWDRKSLDCGLGEKGKVRQV